MKIPPSTVAMHIVEGDRTTFRIWFPLFLIWPLMALFLILALVAALLADVAGLAAGQRHTYTRLVVGGLEVVGESRGTHVSVEHGKGTFFLALR